MAAIAVDSEQIALLAALRTQWSAYEKSLALALDRFDAGDPRSAQVEFEARTRQAFAGAAKVIDDLLGISKEQGRSATGKVRSVYGPSLALIIGVLLFAALSAGGAIRWISLNVSKPILKISNAMQRLTAGDNSAAVSEGMNRKDEIGVLVGAVNGYRDSLNRIRQLANEAERERQRLDAALKNMSQGLCMFDADEKLVVFNPRFAEIFRLPPGEIAPGMMTRELMALAANSGMATDEVPEAALGHQQNLIHAHKAGSAIERLSDGRSVSILHRPMPGGGAVVTFEDITDRILAEEKISHLARFDALTDLPNRVTFYERMEAALARLRHSESVAVLSLDLDDFKNVNDTLGHPIGDLLLQAAAQRMRNCVRDEDIVARLGGDEFAIVQSPSAEPQNVTNLASRLIDVVGAPYDVDGHQVVAGVSVGVAIAPADGDKPDLLMKNADLALYRAKADGGGTYRFFEPEMDARMQARRTLELDLRKAVVKGEFEVWYQPILNVKTGRITSCEALIRWHHPQRGMVPPLEFIPVAEETGLIVHIGEWALRQACSEAAHWPDSVGVAVNLSPAQFKNRNLVQAVMSALAASGLATDRLELEITELVLLQESEGAFEILHQLRGFGIKIAMDDFGTGYSSLGYLRRFPFDKIKIEQSFIRDLPTKEDSVAIVRAVVGLSSSLGITTTAEGVETKEQLMQLTAEGCDEVQGFLFSPPKPVADIERMLHELVPREARVA